MSDRPSDVGSILKAERTRRCLTIDMVHEATKIPQDSLKAIEEGYKVRTLTPFYFKGFVRSYAVYLGLDPLPLMAIIASAGDKAKKEQADVQAVRPVKQFSSSTPVSSIASGGVSAAQAERKLERKPERKVDQKRPLSPNSANQSTVSNSGGAETKKSDLDLFNQMDRMPTSSRIGLKVAALAGAFVLLIAIAFLAFIGVRKLAGAVQGAVASAARKEHRVPEKKTEKETHKKGNDPSVVTPVRKPDQSRTETDKKRSESVSVPAAAAAPRNEKAVKPEPVVKAVVAQTAAAESGRVAQTAAADTVVARAVKSVMVSVRATNNSWLVVKADGHTTFQGILKKGAVETWTGSKVIEISGKDIDLLEFEVNGKPVGKLSRRETNARKIRITPEGLTVEK